MTDNDEKLQKVLARAGLGSRREMERVIEAGRVRVNGKVATIGDRVGPKDKIKLDGKPVKNSGGGGQRDLGIPYFRRYLHRLGVGRDRADGRGFGLR